MKVESSVVIYNREPVLLESNLLTLMKLRPMNFKKTFYDACKHSSKKFVYKCPPTPFSLLRMLNKDISHFYATK